MGELVQYRSIVADNSRWEGFSFRDDDVVIVTPPKCGTTWMQMICAMVVFQDPVLPKKLTELSPWLDMTTNPIDEVVAALEAQTHRRFIKTHTPLDGLPVGEGVTYLFVARDPRDVFFSWENHMANMDLNNFLTARGAAVGNEDVPEFMAKIPTDVPDDPVGRFLYWADETVPVSDAVLNLDAMFHHLNLAWSRREDPRVMLFHYADMKRDLEGEMRRLAKGLAIEVPEEKWPALVEAATFEKMKERADDLAPDVTNGIWQDNKQFFQQGGTRWTGILTDEALAHYEERVAALAASPELVAWVHDGWRGAPTPT